MPDEQTWKEKFDNASTYIDFTPNVGRTEENVLIWGLDPKEILFQIECYLRGIAFDNKGLAIQKYKPLLNEDGICAVMTTLRAHLNKYITLSNLAKEDVLRIARDVRFEITELLYYNWYNYGLIQDNKYNHGQYIPNIANMDMVLDVVDHNVYPNLRRALDAGERNAMRTVMRFIQSISDKTNPEERKKESMFNRLNIFRK